MESTLQLTVNRPMEFLYALFAAGTGKHFTDMIRSYDLEPGDDIKNALRNMDAALSRYLRQELEYFYDLSGVGYILYKTIAARPELEDIPELLETFRAKSAREFLFEILQSVCKNTLPPKEDPAYRELPENREGQLALLKRTPFQDAERKRRVTEAAENPEEIKMRFELLLSRFYAAAYAPLEDGIIRLIEHGRENYERSLSENPAVFKQKYISLENVKNTDNIENVETAGDVQKQTERCYVHLSFFKYAGCHAYSSYGSGEDDWFVLGLYSDRLFQESRLLEKQAAFFKVLADPKRIAILRLLKERPWFGQELAEKLDISPPTVSYHMGFLQQIGAVSFVRTDNRFYYSLNTSRLIAPVRQFIDGFEEE
ncbi:winged helix-turn-helix transcriptional regulator [Paenibacillus sp. HN-1]|uniref:ArsR/SmtB family transcription factor n=1 Tax=Paenibacillus TaxID=44249 RepID=UPI001CA8DF4D|nr:MULTISPECIES: metalloregulator ArsR/SmtB family transcription factor [Paenibacillus]MBY9078695.1 winged helix-turn-helix transcriptional regulator [Paenibacillus sp. CGMCC 1.18879]MBY9084231.1 winged helix-turn-helix transcriptional regulator [Paenibacillus sinensis]